MKIFDYKGRDLDGKSVKGRIFSTTEHAAAKRLISEDDLLPLYDDLNTPKYISNLHKLFDKSQSGNLEDKEKFVSACNFIGLLSQNKNEWIKFKEKKSEIDVNYIEDKIIKPRGNLNNDR